ncbi:unnamed protein product [Moneuplotes crassus]|uniref:Uncharacterized protein n=1 Tax=Euplotes crassus TaxID=5936 RepID=A0AAD1X8F5_EUPCR|nr:unnamed protein product [Moneuplotes crassus]
MLYLDKFEELREAELFNSYGGAYEYTQKLDRFNPQNKETFVQKYFDVDKYWDPEIGPLFLYICGESICEEPADNRFVVNLAKKSNVRVLALEHIYYGYSQPKPDWSTETFEEGRAEEIFQKLGFGFEYSTSIELIEYLANYLAWAIQYGSRTSLCDQISNAGENLGNYINFILYTPMQYGLKITDFFKENSARISLDTYSYIRQWMHQICSTLGYFQTY